MSDDLPSLHTIDAEEEAVDIVTKTDSLPNGDLGLVGILLVVVLVLFLCLVLLMAHILLHISVKVGNLIVVYQSHQFLQDGSAGLVLGHRRGVAVLVGADNGQQEQYETDGINPIDNHFLAIGQCQYQLVGDIAVSGFPDGDLSLGTAVTTVIVRGLVDPVRCDPSP